MSDKTAVEAVLHQRIKGITRMNDTLQIAAKAVQMYAETHPRPPHVTQRQAAAMLDVSPPTVGRIIRAGRLTLNGAGLIPIHQIDALLEAKKAA